MRSEKLGRTSYKFFLALFLGAVALLCINSNSAKIALAQHPEATPSVIAGYGPRALSGPDCASPVVFDDQWGSGYRLVCQNHFYVLMVDLTNPAVKVEVVAGTGIHSLSWFADGNTIALINGDYAWPCTSGDNCAQGVTISNGSNPNTYTNPWHFCHDALYRRQIGFSPDGRAMIDWGYRFISDSQMRSWCSQYGVPMPGSGGGREGYNHNVVGGGPHFRYSGSFHWDCGYGSVGTSGASNCKSSGNDVIINDEHFGVSATNWWQQYQSTIGYSSDGTVLVLGESNLYTHSMRDAHDLMYQRLSAYGKALEEALKFDSDTKAGFWYYNHTYDSTPNVTVPNAVRIQRTNSTCYSVSTNVNPGGAGNISVNTSSNCAQGKYSPGTNVQLTANANPGYTFNGWSGCDSTSGNICYVTMNSNRSVTANFQSAPGAFSKSGPSNGATGISTNPILSWGSSSGATSYEYCYDTINNSSCDTSWASTANTSANLSGLNNNTTYFWQVRARNAVGMTEADGGTWWSFTTQIGLPGAFNKSSPSNGAGGQAINLTLSWGNSTGVTNYEYCYDTVNNGSCDGTWASTAGTSANLSGLSNGTTYYWQVRARNGAGTTEANGGWWSFTTLTATCTPSGVPPVPNLLSPPDGATVNNSTPTLDWADISGSYCIDYYNIQIYEDGGGQVDIAWPAVSNYTVPSGKLTTGKKYSWLLWAHNSLGFGNGNARSFWVVTNTGNRIYLPYILK